MVVQCPLGSIGQDATLRSMRNRESNPQHTLKCLEGSYIQKVARSKTTYACNCVRTLSHYVVYHMSVCFLLNARNYRPFCRVFVLNTLVLLFIDVNIFPTTLTPVHKSGIFGLFSNPLFHHYAVRLRSITTHSHLRSQRYGCIRLIFAHLH